MPIMKTFVLKSLMILIILKLVLGTNYCDVSEKHIMCDKVLQLKPEECPKDFKLAKPTKSYKKMILDLYNGIRNNFSQGHPSENYPKAANMKTLTWDDELARAAERKSVNCLLDVNCDKCSLFDRFQARPKTIAMSFKHIKGYPTLTKTLYEDQRKLFPTKSLSNYDHNTSYNTFTVLTYANTKYVGCARSYSVRGSLFGNQIFEVCFFAPSESNHNNRLYIKGKPCSKCPKGCSKKYPALCNTMGNSLTDKNNASINDAKKNKQSHYRNMKGTLLEEMKIASGNSSNGNVVLTGRAFDGKIKPEDTFQKLNNVEELTTEFFGKIFPVETFTESSTQKFAVVSPKLAVKSVKLPIPLNISTEMEGLISSPSTTELGEPNKTPVTVAPLDLPLFASAGNIFSNDEPLPIMDLVEQDQTVTSSNTDNSSSSVIWHSCQILIWLSIVCQVFLRAV